MFRNKRWEIIRVCWENRIKIESWINEYNNDNSHGGLIQVGVGYELTDYEILVSIIVYDMVSHNTYFLGDGNYVARKDGEIIFIKI